jgi:four helix bundle protein
MHNFREMHIWKDAVALAKSIYTLCSNFPAHEKYGLCSQLQRAAVSVAANIAEGSGRSSEAEFKRFLNISISSAYEVETLLFIAKEVGYFNDESFNTMNAEVQKIQRMIFNFNKQLSA